MGRRKTRVIPRALARRIRLVGLDVDGVMTDGGLYIAGFQGARLEMKRYDAQDGPAVYLLRKAGLRVAIVTGRESESVRIRGEELKVDAIEQDAGARKLPAWQRVCAKLGIPESEAAFVGDDIPDLGIMRRVGLPVAPANARAEILALAKVRLRASGGRGAVREFVELLLKARGEWKGLVETYVTEKSAAPAVGAV